MRLVVDIDNVLCNTTETAIRFIERDLGLAYKPAVVGNGDIASWFNAEHRAKVGEYVEALFKSEAFYAALKPMTGAVDALHWFAGRGYLIAYVSARPDSMLATTVDWLEVHGFPKAPVALTDGQSKVPAVEYFNATVMVEDNPAHAVEIANVGIDVMLFDYPYNRHIEHELIWRMGKPHWKNLKFFVEHL